MAHINKSGVWFYLGPDGVSVIESDLSAEGVPSGSTVLCCPGATLPEDLVARHDLAARLEARPEPEPEPEPAETIEDSGSDPQSEIRNPKSPEAKAIHVEDVDVEDKAVRAPRRGGK